MTAPGNGSEIDAELDIIPETEDVHPDRRAHGKTDKHLDDDALEQRTQHERDEVAADAADKARRDGRPDPTGRDDVPPATD